MAFENLFFRIPRSIGGVTMDAVVEESHVNSYTPTSNPVELGAEISDHTIINPKQVAIKARVSDTPIGFAAVTQLVDLVNGLFGSSTSTNATRSQQAYNVLRALADAREPIEITTRLVVYENMVITNFAVTQDKDTSRAIDINITLQEVILTESKTVPIPASTVTGSTKQQAASNSDKGRQEPKTVETETPKNRSTAKTILGWF